MRSRVWRALRDWRVWALVLTVQGPGARVLVRYAPLPAIVLPLVFTVSFFVYAACLHGPLIAWARRLGSRLAVMILVLGAAAGLNAAIYPHVDALKVTGGGSDEDDAVIVLAGRLIRGLRPAYVPTYLGNTPSVGPAWALLVSPLAVTGAWALTTPLSVAVLAWTVRRLGGGDAGTALAALLPIGSIGFWELSVTGSDLFAVGVLFVALAALLWRWRTPGAGTAIVASVLVCAAASSRAPFAWVTANLALFMRRARRARADLVFLLTAVTLAAEAWLWWPDRDRTPFYLLSKLAGLLGPAGVLAAFVVALGSAAWAYAQLDDGLESWWRGLWMLLAAPLAVVSVGVLAALGWHIASWQAASYLEVAVPALAAYVALDTGRRAAGEP